MSSGVRADQLSPSHVTNLSKRAPIGLQASGGLTSPLQCPTDHILDHDAMGLLLI